MTTHVTAPDPAAVEALHQILAPHFVMWHEAEDARPSEWRCACGRRFGFSDSAITHQGTEILAAIARGEVPGVTLAADRTCGHPNHGAADHDCAPFLAAAQQSGIPHEAVEALADWHETKAEKARRFRPEVNGENRVMDKAAEVHEDADRRLRALLAEGAGR